VRRWKVDVKVDFENKKWFQVIAYTVLLTGRIKSGIFPKTIKIFEFQMLLKYCILSEKPVPFQGQCSTDLLLIIVYC